MSAGERDSGSCVKISTEGHPLLDLSNALILRSFEEGFVKKQRAGR